MSRVTARRWWILAFVYMAGLFALSSVPDDPERPGIGSYFPRPSVQNALHVPAYALLSFLMWRALSPPRPKALERAGRGPGGTASTFAHRHAAPLAAVLATAYGITDEIHQMFVVGRMASATDALANALGAFAVAAWAAITAPRPPTPP